MAKPRFEPRTVRPQPTFFFPTRTSSGAGKRQRPRLWHPHSAFLFVPGEHTHHLLEGSPVKKQEQIVLEVQMQGNFTTQGILAPCFYQLLEKSYQSPLESPPQSSWKSWFLRCQQGLWIQSQQELLLAVKTHAMLPPAVQEGKCPAAAYAFGGLPQVFRVPFPACCQPGKEDAWSTRCIP